MEEEADLDLFLMNYLEGDADLDLCLVPPPPELSSVPLAPPPLPPRPTPTPSNASITSGAASPSSGSSGISSVTEGARSFSSSPFSPRLKTNTTKQKASSSNNRSTSFIAEVAAAGVADAATAAAAAASLRSPPPPYTADLYPSKGPPSYLASAPVPASPPPLPRRPLADISPRPSRTSHTSSFSSSSSCCNSGATATTSAASSSPVVTTATLHGLRGSGGGGGGGGGGDGSENSCCVGAGSSGGGSSSSSCNGSSGGSGGGSVTVTDGGLVSVSGGPWYPSLPPLSAARATAPAAAAAAAPAVPRAVAPAAPAAAAPAVRAAAAPAVQATAPVVQAAAPAVQAAAPAVPAPASASSPAFGGFQPVGAKSSSYYSASASPSDNGKRGSFSWNKLGRSVVGTVLGTAAVGKVGDGGTGGRGVGSGGPTRELSEPEVQQLAEGKVDVSVWRKNKQDAQPVKVQIGVYNSAYEGERAAEAFCPPKWQEPNKDSRCAVCDSTFGFVYSRRHHCRNCGRLVCSSCAEAFWPRSMLPSTYRVDTSEKKVRICSTCHGASENFRKALLSGSEEGVMEAYSTGCVNLRAPYTIYRQELPVHCAAAGGNLNIMAWLVEDRCCPLFFDPQKTIALGDSGSRSVIAAAAASGHIHVMRYLALTQGCKVTEIKDQKALWCALHKCMYERGDVAPVPAEANSSPLLRPTGAYPTVSGDDCCGGTGGTGGDGGGGGGFGGGGGSEGGGVYPTAPPMPAPGGPNGAEVVRAVSVDDKSCIVCFERQVDCTLVPCGHHCCCLICAAQFEKCPVCRADVEQKIRAISV